MDAATEDLDLDEPRSHAVNLAPTALAVVGLALGVLAGAGLGA